MNRDRLHLWQDRLARNDSQYENWYARMDERERLYQGSRYIFPLVNKYRPSNAKTPHVRNICSELIEAQVDSNIPSPKVTAVHEKDEPLAKIIEDMLRNEMDRLPFAEINDLMERIVPIQGGGAYLVEWDNTARTHTTIGELNVVPIHPRQMVPQDGVYSGIEDMDYIILKMPQTREYIYRRYGKDVSVEGEAEPDIKGGDGSTAEDMVTQYIAYYRNDAGGIGMYSWVGDVELEDLEDYQARRLRRCAVCGELEPTADDGDGEQHALEEEEDTEEPADGVAADRACPLMMRTGAEPCAGSTESSGPKRMKRTKSRRTTRHGAALTAARQSGFTAKRNMKRSGRPSRQAWGIVYRARRRKCISPESLMSSRDFPSRR